MGVAGMTDGGCRDDGMLRRNEGFAPRPPRAYPCVLAALARVPFRGAKGDVSGKARILVGVVRLDSIECGLI